MTAKSNMSPQTTLISQLNMVNKYLQIFLKKACTLKLYLRTNHSKNQLLFT